MATPSDAEMERTKTIVKNLVEPKLKAIVDALNDTLKKQGLRAGLDIGWHIEKIEGEGTNGKPTEQ